MAAGRTYTPIATTTLSSASSTVTFNSIPSTYTDLILICNLAATNGTGYVPFLRFNSDSGSNYSNTGLYGTGSTAASARTSNDVYAYISYLIGTSTSPSTFICNINNYANSTTYKTVLSRGNILGGSYPGTAATVSLWRNTAAITSLTVNMNTSDSFTAGSTFTLYGIAAA